MITIASAVTLSHVLTTGCDPGLAPILERYRPLMSNEPLAQLFIVQPGDREEVVTALRGRPFQHWEFILADRGWFEAVFVYGQDGWGHVVLVPDSDAADPELLALCREHAVTDL